MKRLFTILMVVAAPAVMNAQSRIITQIPREVSLPKNIKPISIADQKTISGAEVLPVASYPTPKSNMSTAKRSAGAFSYKSIGQTYYDLQTNRSVCRRVALHANGEVSAIWTYSLQTNDQYTDRGTGYNNKPAGGEWGDIPEKRFEPRRNGWPNITIDANNRETISVHNAEPGTTKADTSFSLVKNTPANRRSVMRYTPLGLSRAVIWNRTAAASGINGQDFLYVLNNWNNASNGTFKDPRNGVTDPTYYSRSVDGGITFAATDTMLFPAGYDSTRFDGGGGDSYSIDARDSVVAFVLGNETTDIAMWKSTKYGAPGTFIKTTIDSFKYAPYNNQGTNGDTLEVNASDFSLLIDKSGNVHVFYSVVNILGDSGANLSLIAGNAIYHWSEITKTKTIAGQALDLDGDGEVTPGSDFNSARYGTYSFANHPTSGIDKDGNLYLVYSAISELDTTDINFGEAIGRNYADLYYTISLDSGKSWAVPVNITNNSGADLQLEDQFPSMSRDVDSYVHLIWQQDSEPGTHVGLNTPSHSPTENIIQYMEIPAVGVGYNVLKGLPGVEINAYPNPASNQVTFTASVQKNMNMTFSMKNMLGQEVAKISQGNIAQGFSTFNVSLENVPSGIYFYTMTSNGQAITKKLVVTK